MTAATQPAKLTALSAYLPISIGLFLLAAATAALFWVRVLDPDVLMHLRTGHWILQHRQIPRADIFSANAAGRPWTTHEWLWEVLAYSGYRVAQWNALYALRLALITGALGFSIWAAIRAGVSASAAIAASLLAVGSLAFFAEIRPQLASECFFGLTLLLVQAIITSQAPANQPAPDVTPPPPHPTLNGRIAIPITLLCLLFALWSNVHGAVLLGFAVLGCGLLAAAISRQWHTLRALAITTAICVLAAMCNPHGIGIYTFPFKVVGQESSRMQIYDWSRPDIRWPFWLLVLLSAALTAMQLLPSPGKFVSRDETPAPKEGHRKEHSKTVAQAALLRLQPQQSPLETAKLFHYLLLLLLAVVAIVSRRQIPFFALVAITPCALGIESILVRRRLPARQQWLAQLAAMLLSALSLPFAFHCYTSAGHTLGLRLAPNRFPEIAANRLANLHTQGALLNDYNDGGFLIWRLYPEWPVTMDSRVEVYGPELVEQYEQVWSGASNWPDILRQWQVEAILGRIEITRTLPKHNLYHELAASPDWALVYWDENSQLFLKRGSSLEASSLKPYRVLAPGLSLQQMATRIKTHEDWLALGADLRRSVSEVPENRRAQSLLQSYLSTNYTNSY